jgi:hypothetical protein
VTVVAGVVLVTGGVMALWRFREGRWPWEGEE